MPAGIGREELRELIGLGAQLVEVLPAGDYDWARLPGAVNVPLKELDAPGRGAGPVAACHRVLPRLVLRPEPAGRVAARSGRVRPGV